MKKRYLITIDEDVYKALKMRAIRDNTTVGDLLAGLVDYEPAPVQKTEYKVPISKKAQQQIEEDASAWPVPERYDLRMPRPVPKK